MKRLWSPLFSVEPTFASNFRTIDIDILLCIRRDQLAILQDKEGIAFLLGQECEWATIDGHIDVIIEDVDKKPKIEFEHCPRMEVHVTSGSSRFLEIAADRAQTKPRDLLVMFAPLAISSEMIRQLQQAVRVDPMTGFAVPRIASMNGVNINVIPGMPGPEPLQFHREFLQTMEPVYILPEVASAAILIRSDVLAAIPIPQGYLRLASSLHAFISDARRCGFLTLVDNRCIVPSLDDRPAYIDVLTEDAARYSIQFNCAPRVRERIRNHDDVRWERLCAGLVARRPRSSPSILLDARNLQAKHNGTGVSILGLLKGLEAANSTENVRVLVNSDAEEFHKLRRRFSNICFMQTVSDQRFDVVLFLSQCWTLGLWQELHTWGRAIGAAMLDSSGSIPCISAKKLISMLSNSAQSTPMD